MPVRRRTVVIATAASLALLLGLSFILTAGGSLDPAAAGAAPSVAPVAVQPVPGVALALVRTGASHSLEALVLSGGSRFRPRTLAHVAVVVRHPQGTLLFDTGLGSEIDVQFEEMPAWLRPVMDYDLTRCARDQLRDGGIAPESLKAIVISHLHWDHASGIEDFPGVEVWTSPAELEWARASVAEEPGLLGSQFDDPDIRWKGVELKEQPYAGFPRSHDVFGDGSVVLVPVPGHTPGSLGMFVTVGSGRRFLFTGDTSWVAEGFQRPAPKFWFARRLVDADPAATARALWHVHALMQEDPQLTVVPAHDALVHQGLAHFPAWEE